MIISSQIKKYSKELHALYDEKHKLSQRYGDVVESDDNTGEAERINKEIEEVSCKIAMLIENEYALAVFEKYKKKGPMLIRVNTGEEVPWDEAFGQNYAMVSKSLRHSLVGLVEKPGQYSLKK